jgi:two-component system, LytTR family, response regulator
MEITAVIIDDEVNSRQALKNLLEFYCPKVNLIGEADGVHSGFELIGQTNPQLVFLDIRMPDGTGFDLLRRFKKIPFKLIFVTAYDQYALNAIKLSAVDYLLKPVNPKELNYALEKAYNQIETDEQLGQRIETIEENIEQFPKNKKIILNTASNMYVLRLDNIVRFESDENYTKVHLNDKQIIMVTRTLKDFDELLNDSGFCRVHNSHIVNLNYVASLEKGVIGQIVLIDGIKVPISSRRKDYFINRLHQIS